MTNFNSPVTNEQIEKMKSNLKDRPDKNIVTNAIASNGINKTAINAKVFAKLNHTFSDEIKTGKVANQKHSGRCWLFALLNTLRHDFANKYKVKDFELSQSYLFFWDKIERANTFYTRMIAMASLDTTDREVSFYLNHPGEDGGQWANAAALVEKYGVVPREVFPENAVTENTTDFDAVLDHKMKHDAMKLRKLVNDGASDEDIIAAKNKFMQEIYRITAESIGVPPTKFDLEYRDDNNEYHLEQGLNPKTFYDKYIGVNLNDFVVLTNAPDKKMDELYSLPSQNNIIDGLEIKFLNAPMETLKKAAIKQIQAGLTVWFGNDVLQQMDRKQGYLDNNLYLYDELFGTDTKMSKAERLKYHEAEVSHAMTITGVDLINDEPRKWKVENSWGNKIGDNGYFVMSDGWMNDYTYEVVINKKYLAKEQLAVLQKPAIALNPWDSLA